MAAELSAEDYFNKAESLRVEGKYKEAIYYYNKAIVIEPDHFAAHIYRRKARMNLPPNTCDKSTTSADDASKAPSSLTYDTETGLELTRHGKNLVKSIDARMNIKLTKLARIMSTLSTLNQETADNLLAKFEQFASAVSAQASGGTAVAIRYVGGNLNFSPGTTVECGAKDEFPGFPKAKSTPTTKYRRRAESQRAHKRPAWPFKKPKTKYATTLRRLLKAKSKAAASSSMAGTSSAASK